MDTSIKNKNKCFENDRGEVKMKGRERKRERKREREWERKNKKGVEEIVTHS